MAYSETNYKTAKAFKEALKLGPVPVYQPGGMYPLREGHSVIEGPHFPEPHRWYVAVIVQGGLAIKLAK